MVYIFHTYVNTQQNTVFIKWEKGDVAVFNNHAMIHTSTPWELYKGKERRFRLTFLNSKKKVSLHPPSFANSQSSSSGYFCMLLCIVIVRSLHGSMQYLAGH